MNVDLQKEQFSCAYIYAVATQFPKGNRCRSVLIPKTTLSAPEHQSPAPKRPPAPRSSKNWVEKRLHLEHEFEVRSRDSETISFSLIANIFGRAVSL